MESLWLQMKHNIQDIDGFCGLQGAHLWKLSAQVTLALC